MSKRVGLREREGVDIGGEELKRFEKWCPEKVPTSLPSGEMKGGE